MIFESKCPIIPGFVESEDENGNPIMVKTPEQLQKESKEEELNRLREQNTYLSTQLAQSDEAAIALFEAQASTDEAVVTLFEMIGGTPT